MRRNSAPLPSRLGRIRWSASSEYGVAAFLYLGHRGGRHLPARTGMEVEVSGGGPESKRLPFRSLASSAAVVSLKPKTGWETLSPRTVLERSKPSGGSHRGCLDLLRDQLFAERTNPEAPADRYNRWPRADRPMRGRATTYLPALLTSRRSTDRSQRIHLVLPIATAKSARASASGVAPSKPGRWDGWPRWSSHSNGVPSTSSSTSSRPSKPVLSRDEPFGLGLFFRGISLGVIC